MQLSLLGLLKVIPRSVDSKWDFSIERVGPPSLPADRRGASAGYCAVRFTASSQMASFSPLLTTQS
jgi:hypothetical protein